MGKRHVTLTSVKVTAVWHNDMMGLTYDGRTIFHYNGAVGKECGCFEKLLGVGLLSGEVSVVRAN